MIIIIKPMTAQVTDTSKTYSISEAAHIIHVSPHVLRRWESEGNIVSSIRTEQGHRRYTQEDLSKIKEHKNRVDDISYVTQKNVMDHMESVYVQEKEKLYKVKAKYVKYSIGVLIALIGINGLVLLPKALSGVFRISREALISFNRERGAIVLAASTNVADYILNINSSANFARDISSDGNLSVTGNAELSGGISTNNANGDFGTGTINAGNLTLSGDSAILGLSTVDEQTETTLEGAIDIDGDVVGTGLNTVKIKEKLLNETYLADTINYDGDFIFNGLVDLEGEWQIGGTTVEATADELNILSGIDASTDELNILSGIDADTDELNYLAGSSVASGGIIFGNGSRFVQDTTNLFWDDTNNRLGIGTNTPNSLLSVGATSNFQVDSNGDLINIKGISYSWPSIQGEPDTLLTNDGSGNLRWASATGTGTLGYWNRTETTLIPTTNSDTIVTLGKIGIGMTDPSATLSMRGDFYIEKAIYSDDYSYSTATIPYGFSTFAETTVTFNSLDDGISNPIDIPFTFNFFGTEYSAVRVMTNGYISFTDTEVYYSPDTIPDPEMPNNSIYGFMHDLNLQNGGTVTYGTSGTTPNRVFIIYFDSVAHYGNDNPPVTFQIKLFENTNVIEIHCQDCTTTHGSALQGVENAEGTVGITMEQRNNVTFSLSDDAVQLSPVVPGNFLGYGTSFYVDDQGSVGIGTSRPAGLLDVDNKLTVLSDGRVGIGNTSPTGVFDIGDYFTVQNNGNVGIGTLMPNGPLEINEVFVVLSNGSTGIGTTNPIGMLDVFNKFLIQQNGNVGIGTTLPAFKLDLAGSERAYGIVTQDITLSSLATNIITAVNGFNGYTNFSGGIGTGGISKNSITGAQRLTSTGNLINIGSIQAGDTLLTSGGSFADKVDKATGSGPQNMAALDLNGDERADVAVLNSIGNTVSIYINNGNGTFADKVDIATNPNPRAIALGDLNGDGKNDMVITNGSSISYVSVYYNNGDGTFENRVDVHAIGGYADIASVALGDLNSDGKSDIAITRRSNNIVETLINNGNRTYTPYSSKTTGGWPKDVAIGDLNGDGKADLVVANEASNTASIYLNDGTGMFADKVDKTTGAEPLAVVIGDLSEDGKADFAVVNRTSSSISTFINNGNGTFADKVDKSTNSDPRRIAMGDLNGDGKQDIVTSDNMYPTNPSRISIFINRGNGVFADKVDKATGHGAIGLAIAEFNGDGKADIAVVNYYHNTFSTFLNTPSTVFYAKTSNSSVGIGTSSPINKLDVLGNLAVGTYAGTDYAPSNSLIVSGNIGIGTTSPTQKLDVVGQIELANYLYFGNASTEYLRWDGSNFLFSDDLLPAAVDTSNLGATSAEWNSMYLADGSGLSAGGGIFLGNDQDFLLTYDETTSDALELADGTNTFLSVKDRGTAADFTFNNASLFAKYDGNVSIGSTNPTSKLTIGETNQFSVDASGNLTRVNDVAYSWPSLQGESSSVLTNNGSGTLTWASSTGSGILGYWNRTGTMLTPTTISDSISTLGNVGVGTSTPTSKLDVRGDIYISRENYLKTQSAHNFLLLESGIGTSYLSSGSSTYFRIDNDNNSSSDFFSFSSDGGGTELMRINETGNVGIGTTNPSAKLQIDKPSGETALYINATGFGTQNILMAANYGGSRIFSMYMDENWRNVMTSSSGYYFPTTSATTTNVATYKNGAASTMSSAPVVDIRNEQTAFTGDQMKTGLYLASTGSWTGPNSVNRALYVTAQGGTVNYAAIFDSGNVGIGTTNPTDKLVIAGGMVSMPYQSSIPLGYRTSLGNTQGSLWGMYGSNNMDIRDRMVLSANWYQTGPSTDVTYGADPAAIILGARNDYGTVPFEVLVGTAGSRPATSVLAATRTGLVGVGTTSPLAQLTLSQPGSSSTSGLRLNYGSSYSGFYLNSNEQLAMYHNSNTAMLVSGSYVGFGASPPGYKVDIEDSRSGTYATNIANLSSTGWGLHVRGGSTSSQRILQLDGGSNELVTVLGSGNVGIGTTNPGKLLNISSTSSSSVFRISRMGAVGTGDIIGDIEFMRNNDLTIAGRIRSLSLNHNGNDHSALIFSTARSGGALVDAMYINDVQYVGIGLTNPSTQLSVGTTSSSVANDGTYSTYLGGLNVRANGYNSYVATIENTYGNGGPGLLIKAGRAADNYPALHVMDWSTNASLLIARTGGNIGIGTTNPTSRLEVVGGDIKVTGGSFIDDGTTLTVPDYVFEDSYSQLSLSQLEDYVKSNKHMPNVPDMEDISGWAALSLQDRDMLLLEKIEENTLYILQLNTLLNSPETSGSDLVTEVSEIQALYQNLMDTFFTLGMSNEDGKLAVDGDVQVAGNISAMEFEASKGISAGAMYIDSLEDSINVLGASCFNEEINKLNIELCSEQALKLQTEKSGFVDIFNGEIILSPDGTITANKLQVNEIEITDDEILGTATIRKGETSVRVDTSKVRDNSRVFVTPTTETGKQSLIVMSKIEGEYFEVRIEENYEKDINFDWWILNASN